MKKFIKFFIFCSLFFIFYGCFLYRPKQKICKVIYSEKLLQPLKTIAILPVSIGFNTGDATAFVPLVKSPLVIEDKTKIWSDRREEKMIVDRKTAVEIGKNTSEYLYTVIQKKKKFRRVVHSDSVKNVMDNKKINLGDFRQINDLNAPPTMEKLSKIAGVLEVDGLIIGVMKKCETGIVYASVRSAERDSLGEYQGEMNYFYKFELEVGVFSAPENKFFWIGKYEKIKSNRTPELEQNILVAVVTGSFEKFFRKYLTEKILKEGPEYQCVLRIVNTLPF